MALTTLNPAKNVGGSQADPTNPKGAGGNNTVGSVTDQEYVLFEGYDLVSLGPVASVTSAIYSKHQYAGTGTGPGTIAINRLRRQFTEAAGSWNNYAAGQAWTTPGARSTTGDIYSANAAAATWDATVGTRTIDLAAMVRDALAYGTGVPSSVPFEFAIFSEPNGSNYGSFRGRTDPTNPPTLAVTYTPGVPWKPATPTLTTQPSGRSVGVTFAAPFGATTTTLYRSTSSDRSAPIPVSTTVGEAIDAALPFGTWYYWSVGTNAQGDSTPSDLLTVYNSPISGPFTLTHTKLIGGGGNSWTGGGAAANTDISTVTDPLIGSAAWTSVAAFAGGVLEAVGSDGGFRLRAGGTETGLYRAAEFNRGRVMRARFSYDDANMTAGAVLRVGIKVSTQAGGFCGYTVSLMKEAAANTFYLWTQRYDNGTPTQLNYSASVVLSPSTDYILAIGATTGYTYHPEAELRLASDESLLVGGGPVAKDWTYRGSSTNSIAHKTMVGIGNTHITVKYADNGADSWFVEALNLVTDDGDWTLPHRDGLGRLQATMIVGDGVSTDQIAAARSVSGTFSNTERIYDDGTSRVGPIIVSGEPTDAGGTTWPTGNSNYKAQFPCVIYDTAAGLYKAWFMSDKGDNAYRIYHAYASPDANGAMPSTYAGWTYSASNPLTVATGTTHQFWPLVVKRSSRYTHANYTAGFTYSGTTYDYVMLCIGTTDTPTLFRAYSNDGTTWTVGSTTISVGLLQIISQFSWDDTLKRWFLITDDGAAEPYTQRLYVSADNATWTRVGTASILAAGTPNVDIDAYKRTLSAYKLGRDVVIFYGGDLHRTGITANTWPDLSVFGSSWVNAVKTTRRLARRIATRTV